MADREMREAVRLRAGDRCEYCQLPRAFQAAPYHVEHIIARQHLGTTEPENMAWACSHCNLHKGPNVAGIESGTGSLLRLFNPRVDRWSDHFRFDGARIVGLSAVGRVTVQVLNLNDPAYVDLRSSLIAEGIFPPTQTA